MNLDTYKIHGELYQGSIPPGGRVIADAGFDVLVLCAWENQDASFYDDVEVILAPGDDVNETPIDSQELANWTKAATTVYERLKAGKKVLVTCIGGYNRSGMVTSIALHHVTGWSGNDIVDHVSTKRPGALHNKSFVNWLRTNLKKAQDE